MEEDSVSYLVVTLIYPDTWEDCWQEDGEAIRFATEALAEAEIVDHIHSCRHC